MKKAALSLPKENTTTTSSAKRSNRSLELVVGNSKLELPNDLTNVKIRDATYGIVFMDNPKNKPYTTEPYATLYRKRRQICVYNIQPDPQNYDAIRKLIAESEKPLGARVQRENVAGIEEQQILDKIGFSDW